MTIVVTIMMNFNIILVVVGNPGNLPPDQVNF
jgi:hypothetical protein